MKNGPGSLSLIRCTALIWQTIESALHMVNLKTFKDLGRVTAHEEVLDRGLLVHVHTYQDLVKFVEEHPTAFISHQWVAWADPDPDNLQFNDMVASLEALCREHDYEEERLHIFLDYT